MAKVAVATATAALTMTVVGATTGVVPFNGNHPGPGIAQGATAQAPAVVDPPTPAGSGDAGVVADTEASVTPPVGSTSAAAKATGAVGAAATPDPSSTDSSASGPSTPNPSLALPGAGVPDLSSLTQVPAQVLSCLTPVLDLVKGLPAVSVDKISQIGPAIVSCVTGIVSGLPLPSGLSACISGILGFVSNVTSQAPTGVPDLGGLDLTSCIPAGLPVPGLAGGLPFMGGGFPFGR